MTDMWADTDEEVEHPLLGQQVRVRLHEDHWVSGRLVKLTTGGEVDLDQGDGTTLYCWPALDIEPAAEAQ